MGRLIGLWRGTALGPFERAQDDRRAVGIKPLERFAARQHSDGVARLLDALFGLQQRRAHIDRDLDGHLIAVALG